MAATVFRQRLRVTVDGHPHDLVTSARDYAAAQTGAEDDTPAVLITLGVLHAAMIRLGIDGVPSDFEEFTDLIDSFEELDGIPVASAGLPDPTRPVD